MSGLGTVLGREAPAGRLGRPWSYACYLPPEHDAARPEPYPLVLLLHGRGGDRWSWLDAGLASWLNAVIAAGKVPPLVAVMPDGASDWWVDGREPLESALLRDLLPEAEAALNAGGTRARRLVGGYSMGGYGAVRYFLAHPGLFSAGLALSPAIYDDLPPSGSSARRSRAFGTPFDGDRWQASNYPAALAALPKDHALRLYLAVGDREYAHADPSHDADVQAARLYAAARRRGIDARLRFFAARHDWSLWAPAFLDGLRFLLPGPATDNHPR